MFSTDTVVHGVKISRNGLCVHSVCQVGPPSDDGATLDARKKEIKMRLRLLYLEKVEASKGS